MANLFIIRFKQFRCQNAQNFKIILQLLLRLVPWLLEAVKGQKLANFLFIISRTMLIKKPRLNQRGKEASFYYPQKADILVVLYSDILTTVDATTKN